MAKDTSELPASTAAKLADSIQFTLSSKITGRTYRIYVFAPKVQPPPSGFPVVFIADANMLFPIAAGMGAAFAFGNKPALIVGIGYETEDPTEMGKLRLQDLLPASDASQSSEAEQFYRFLVEELRSAIAGAYSVSDTDQTLYGHSLAGLFILDVLFKHPQAFRSFAASSPSIWWNKRSVLDGVPDFLQKVETKEIAPRVLITIGAAEQNVPEPHMLPANMAKLPREQIERQIKEWAMVDNARNLSKTLQQSKGSPNYVVQFQAFEGEDHLTVVAASITRALSFALEV